MRCATRHGHQSWLSSTAINLGYQSRLSSTAINRGCHPRPSISAINPGYHPRPSSSLPSTAAIIHDHQSRPSLPAIIHVHRRHYHQPRLSYTAIVLTTAATRSNSAKTTDILIANALHVGHIFVMVLSSHTCRFLSSSCEILCTHANAAMGFFQILRGRAVVAAFFGDLVWLPGLRQEV